MDLMQKIKSNKIVAPIIVAATILSGIAAFTDTIDVLIERYEHWTNRGKEDIQIIRRGTDGSTARVAEEAEVLSQFGTFASRLVTSGEPNNDPITISKSGLVVNVSATASEPPGGAGRPNYFVHSNQDLFEISPSDDYFDTLASGEIPTSEFDGWEFRLPVIDLKIVNNSNQSVYLTMAAFTIRKSLPDPNPYLTIGDSSNHFTIPIRNIGSGPAVDGVLDFTITDSSGTTRSHQVLLGKIDTYCGECDVEEIFSSVHGVDTGLFEQAYLDDLPTEEEQEIARGAFDTRSVPVEGTFTYRANNANNEVQEVQLSFLTRINLVARKMRVRAPGPASATYDLNLDTGKDNYTRSIDISQIIAPTESDRFQNQDFRRRIIQAPVRHETRL
jgi:hypothetical protein